MDRKEILLKQIEESIAKLDLPFEEALQILNERKKQREEIPISVFTQDKLSALETIVKYLREEKNLTYKEIATLLNRNYDPIAITYRNSKKKLSTRLKVKDSQNIPLTIFSKDKLSVLENIVTYMKDVLKLSYHEIALALRRDDRTIWTVYNRALKK